MVHVRVGLVEFRDALTGLIDEYGQEDQVELPPSRVIGNRRSKQVHVAVIRIFLANT